MADCKSDTDDLVRRSSKSALAAIADPISREPVAVSLSLSAIEQVAVLTSGDGGGDDGGGHQERICSGFEGEQSRFSKLWPQ